MDWLIIIGVVILSYIMGSIPSGLIIVRLITGKDVRDIESGRTGGTNAMRAAGLVAGVATALFDVAKGAASVFLARYAVPGNAWVEIIAPLAAILGHNYSIFLIERTEKGFRLRGGAGGATCAGGMLALWPPGFAIIFLIGLAIFWWVGYASVVTMSVAFIAIVTFAVRAYLGLNPWQYVIYGVIAEIMLLWALRPNIRRLIAGTERLVGLRARQKSQLQVSKNQV